MSVLVFIGCNFRHLPNRSYFRFSRPYSKGSVKIFMTFFFIILWYFFQNVATNCHLSLLFQKLEVSILTLIFKICSYLSLNQKQKQNQATKLQGVYSSDNAEEKPNLILYKDFLEANSGLVWKYFVETGEISCLSCKDLRN